jgi:AcrR family transcriptional regulator
VTAQDTPRPGLRERKRIKLRRSVQTEALRLFDTQGYDQTTVEQITEAADISTTTFYRYFPTKEDVIIDDDYDAILEEIFASTSADEPLVALVRACAAATGAAVEADRDYNLARLRLVATVPVLQARYAGEERRSADLLARLLASQTGRSATDYQVELAAAALVAVLFAASRRWAAEQAATPLTTLMDEAVTIVEPVLGALDGSAGLPVRRLPR